MSDPPERGRVLRGALPMPFGPYTLTERLGVGGMAEVFLAEKEGVAGFHKQVVIKRLLPHLQQQKHYVEMFLREARVASGLSHKNVVQIFELGEESSGDLYIAMEYVNGLTFRALVEKCWSRGDDVPVDVVSRVIADAARGLAHLHAMKGDDGRPLHTVHRDIAPDNLMVSLDGTTKVLDFGIAKPSGAGRLTETGDLKGKIPFMSPEQVEGEALDARSDLFSLGLCLYWALGGVRPFDRNSDLLTLNAIATEPAAPLSTLRPDLDDNLVALCHQLLQKKRGDRPAHGDEVADRLEPFAPRSRERVPALLFAVKDVAVDEERITSRGRASKRGLAGPPPARDLDDALPDTLPAAMLAAPEATTDLVTAGVERRRRRLRIAVAAGASVTLLLALAALLVAEDKPDVMVAPPPPVALAPSGAEADAQAEVEPASSSPVEERVARRRRARRTGRAPSKRAAPVTRKVTLDGDGRIRWQLPDGKVLGRGPGAYDVPADISSVVAFDTWREGKTTVAIDGGRGRLADVKEGEVHFRVLPWAEVFLGKERLGQTPIKPLKLRAGQYRARLVYEDQSKTVGITVTPGQRVQVRHAF
jgi:serine/threonine protein kinase